MSTATLLASHEPGHDGAALPSDMDALAALTAATWARDDAMEPRAACGCLIRNVEVLGHRPSCNDYECPEE